jgi:ribosomal protein S3AE
MAKIITKVIDKWKKKKWFKMVAVVPFKDFELGNTPSNDVNDLKARTVKTNLMHLTRNIRDQNVNITFEIFDVKGDTGFARIKKYELLTTQVKRLTRRRRDKLDDSFVCTTVDGYKVRVKPMLVMNISRGQQKKDIRKAFVESCKTIVSKLRYEHFLMDLIQRKFQRGIQSKLHKVHPVRSFDVRVMNLEGIEEKAPVVEEKKVEVKAE